MNQKNVFGETIEICCSNPLTGYFRDGFCHTSEYDRGSHTVCAIISEEFLVFSHSRGNDLTTPRPEFEFPGLKPGQSWCLCAGRWLEAHEAGFAPKIHLQRTNSEALNIVPMKLLKQYAADLN
ncbi:MAG: DUF2237 domain-containing protein [Porticoccaceae bacterium]|nr:DUF2237 domain-containing protein [Porticoccaceae bacterium]MDG1473911.1 DUF2237 domain-containing protein [Porticoccaceae bacterium]